MNFFGVFVSIKKYNTFFKTDINYIHIIVHNMLNRIKISLFQGSEVFYDSETMLQEFLTLKTALMVYYCILFN